MFRSGFVGNRLKQFKKDEEGSLIVFSLFLFVAMLVFGGIAVDLMLYENRRTHVQNSTDRAVLAAANLELANTTVMAETGEAATAKDVVKDYLAKVGIIVSDDDIVVEDVGIAPVITGRQVSVVVRAQSDTLLMNMIGVDHLPYGAASEAEESVNDVEVSLILDISGSMGNPMSKLTNMQQAANEFVAGVLAGADDNRVSVSLVPYATQVSAGPELIDRLVTTHDHEFSHCVNFIEQDFDTTAIQRWEQATDGDGNLLSQPDGTPIMEIVPLSQTASFDPWSSYSWGRDHYYPVCRGGDNDNDGTEEDDAVDILPWSNDVTALQGRINDLTPSGNTSIDIAMKWGTALLDPSMNDALQSLEDDEFDGIPIDEEFVARPRGHDYPDVLKFIVLMTDGINTTQYELHDEYKEGMSNVYWAWNDHWIEIGGNFWNMDDRCWHYQNQNTCNGSRIPDADDQLTNLEMWDQMPMRWRAYNGFYRRTWQASDYYDARDDPRTYNNQSTKNARLDAICDAAKAAGITVFTIGFEVTDTSADIMEDCASSDQHFYRVTGQDIQYAFASIKNQINQLKLTQ